MSAQESGLSPSPEVPKLSFGWLKNHLGLLSGSILVFAVALKLAVVSHGDVNSLAALLGSSSAGDLALATVAIGLPVVVWVPFYAAASHLARSIRIGDSVGGPLVALSAIAVLACFVSPVSHVLAVVKILGLMVAVAGLVVLFEAWRVRRGHPPRPRPDGFDSTIGASALPVLAILIVAIFISDRPWLPSERLSFKGQEPVAGYVLSEDDQWTTVMHDDTRVVVRHPTPALTERTICALDGARSSQPPLALLLGWEPGTYPPC